MNTKLIGKVIMFSVLVSRAGQTLAQNPDGALSPPMQVVFPPVGSMSMGGWYGWGGSFSSTNAEGYWRGLGDFARGAGEFNYYSSLAKVNREEALRRHVENRRLAVENYFKLQQLNWEARAAEHARKFTPEELVRWSKIDSPSRPTPEQLDPRTGSIHWPELLRDDQYASARVQMETLFAQRTATNSGVGTANYHEIEKAAEELRTQLREHIKEIDPTEFIAVKKLIDSLAYEARFAPNEHAVAAR